MALSKRESKTPEQIKQYISANDRLPKRLYQHTSYEALVEILKNKCFRISRSDLLNDKAEIKLGLIEEHKRSYVMSFTEETEYVSMWTMYGKSIGVKLRFDISTDIFKLLLKDENFWFVDEEGNKRTIKDRTNYLFEVHSKREPIKLSRVVYYNTKTNTLCESGGRDSFPITVDNSLIDELTGFIKYSAWESERETRLRIVLKEEVIRNKDIKYIYFGISDDIIKDMHITFNPWMSSSMKLQLENSLNSIAGINLSYSDSDLTGQIDESILHS